MFTKLSPEIFTNLNITQNMSYMTRKRKEVLREITEQEKLKPYDKYNQISMGTS